MIISTPVGQTISSAVTVFAESTNKVNLYDCSVSSLIFKTNSLSAKTIDVTSSSTPSRDENSCLAPSTSIAYTLAPGKEDNNTLLNALPKVVPKPLSSG